MQEEKRRVLRKISLISGLSTIPLWITVFTLYFKFEPMAASTLMKMIGVTMVFCFTLNVFGFFLGTSGSKPKYGVFLHLIQFVAAVFLASKFG